MLCNLVICCFNSRRRRESLPRKRFLIGERRNRKHLENRIPQERDEGGEDVYLLRLINQTMNVVIHC